LEYVITEEELNVCASGWIDRSSCKQYRLFINTSENSRLIGTSYILRLSYHEKEYLSEKLTLRPSTTDTACWEETLAPDMPSLVSWPCLATGLPMAGSTSTNKKHGQQ